MRQNDATIDRAFIDSDSRRNTGNSFDLKPNPYWIAMNFNLAVRKPFQWFVKRTFDFTSCFIGIVMLIPLFLALAVLIKLESDGPLIFKQKRIGLYGKQFYMYKFRSMKNNADSEFERLKEFNETNQKMFKMVNDPRITKVGKFLRKYSLDELPQLFNVLKGEMSLVGPRPPIQREVDQYEPWHYLRFSTLPGLTGMWQVRGRSDITEFDKVVKLDYQYVSSWNLFLDFRLLLETIPVVLFGKGAS